MIQKQCKAQDCLRLVKYGYQWCSEHVKTEKPKPTKGGKA